MGKPVEIEYYSRALAEIYRLRTALAYEAEILSVHLERKSFPSGRRQAAEAQVQRMREAAKGSSEAAYSVASSFSLRHVRAQHGIETLTRGGWEAAVDAHERGQQDAL